MWKIDDTKDDTQYIKYGYKRNLTTHFTVTKIYGKKITINGLMYIIMILHLSNITYKKNLKQSTLKLFDFSECWENDKKFTNKQPNEDNINMGLH